MHQGRKNAFCVALYETSTFVILVLYKRINVSLAFRKNGDLFFDRYITCSISQKICNVIANYNSSVRQIFVAILVTLTNAKRQT